MVNGPTAAAMPVINLPDKALHFWLIRANKAILYISFDKKVSRQLFKKTGKGRTQIEKKGFTVECIKTEDRAKVHIKKEWASE